VCDVYKSACIVNINSLLLNETAEQPPQFAKKKKRKEKASMKEKATDKANKQNATAPATKHKRKVLGLLLASLDRP
jgi:hypothetical protein